MDGGLGGEPGAGHRDEASQGDHHRTADAPAAALEVASGPSLRLGQRVTHPSFGEGTVMDAEGSGPHARVQVNFERGAEPGLVADDGLHPSAAMYTEWTRLALPVARALLA